MRKILFPIEKLAMVFFYFELLMDLDKVTYAICSLILIGLSLYFEGARIYTVLLILVVLMEALDLKMVQVIIVIIVGIAAALLKIYDIDVPIKGPYLAGHRYKDIKVNDKEVLVSLFYPTLTKTQNPQWVPKQKDYNKVLYQIFHVDPKARRIPYRLFSFVNSYIHKIYMPAYRNSPYLNSTQSFSEDSKYKQNQQKVIIFSHGLGSHLNANSAFCSSWASEGYTVISINHDHDVVCLDYRSISQDHQKIKQFFHKSRNNDLNVRVQQVSTVIDMVLNTPFMKQQFGVQIPIKEIILSGHSFGGGTSLASKSYLNRKLPSEQLQKIKDIICFDPWFFPLAQQDFQNLNNQNVIIINSQYFYQQVPYFYQLQTLFNKVAQKCPKIKAFMVQKMDHLSQCDMAYVFGNVLQITGSIKLQNLSDKFMKLNLLMASLFLQGKQSAQILQISNKYVENSKMDFYRVKVRQEYRTSRNLTFGRKQTEEQHKIQNKI